MFQMYAPRELQKRKLELDTQIAKCYLKLGSWTYDLQGFKDPSVIGTIINYYESAKNHNRDAYKAWQAWAYANYEAIQFYKNNQTLVLPATVSANQRYIIARESLLYYSYYYSKKGKVILLQLLLVLFLFQKSQLLL